MNIYLFTNFGQCHVCAKSPCTGPQYIASQTDDDEIELASYVADVVLQASKFFNQLNIYCPESNRWRQVVTDNCPDGIAGHGATIVGNSMVVFGGYHGHGNRFVVCLSGSITLCCTVVQSIN